MNQTVRSCLPALTLVAACMAGTAAVAATQSLDQAIADLQHQWAHINYEVPDKQKSNAFAKLEAREEALVKQFPGHSEPLIWQAITLSTHAGVHGGLGALSMVKNARDLLLKAEKIDPTALQGSIYTSLGSLYYKVPGWPLGFGDDDKAQAYLKRALALNPDGIDPNYFYGDYLFGQHRYKEAEQVLEHALQAPPRPKRPLADQGRSAEVRALLARVQAELGDAGATRAAAR